MKAVFLSALLLCGLTTSAMAQAYSLEQCIDIALKNNHDYKARLVQHQRAELQVEAGKSSYLPTAQAGLGHNWDFGRSADKTGVMNDRSSMATSLSLSASYTLFDGLARLHNLRAAKLQLEASTAGLAQARQDLSMQVVQYYYAYLHAQRVLESARLQAERSREQKAYAEGLYREGKWSVDRLAEAEAIAAQDEQNVVQAENGVELARLDLRQVMRVDELEIAPPSEDKAVSEAELLLSEADIVERAVALRPALESNRYNQLAAEELVKASRAGYMPSLSLSAGYSNNYYKVLGASMAAFNLPFGEQLKQNGRSYIGLHLSIPIFDAFRTRTQIRQAKLNQREAQVAGEQLETQLRKEVETAILSAQLAKRKLGATAVSLAASVKAGQLTEESWRLGRATSNELGQARNKAFVAGIEHLNAKYDYLLRTELLRYYLKQKP